GRSLALDPTTHDDPADDLETARAKTRTGVGMMAETGLPMTGLPPQMGGKNEHATNVAGFEETVTANPSLQIKAGVQFALFGGAILHLGNAEQHEKWLLAAQAGRLLGSFAMTEIGHGSAVASVATTATDDPHGAAIVIDAPFRAATKEYISTAARDPTAAAACAPAHAAAANNGVQQLLGPVRA